MDCVETKALKTSFWPEITFRPTSQVISEELWCGNGTNDDLFVEGLLDFSNEQVLHEKEDDVDSVSFQQEHNPNFSSSSSWDVKDEFVSVPGSELSVPADDLASLEWLSHFVEDSFSEFSLQHVVVGKPEEKQNRSSPGFGASNLKPVSAFIPGKARSKRSRTDGRVWSLGSLPLPESYSSSPSSSSSSSCLMFDHPGLGQNFDLVNHFGEPPAKKKRRMTEAHQQQRRCSHCGVQKTPQWRTGPLGAKTLCNACGVRYKSGRLFPEYRPACSPTYSMQVHSNNHRKVLEMRRKKEGTQPESELTQTNSSSM